MFDAKQWAYNFLILMVFLVQQQCGSTADDFLSDVTLEPEDIIPIHQPTLTTEVNFRKTNFYQDVETDDEIGLQSSGVDAQKFNNGAVYQDDDVTTFNENNQLQPSRDQDKLLDVDNIFLLSTSESNGFKDWVTNHKKLVHSTFEKHKNHHHNYRRFGHKNHKKSSTKYKKYENLRAQKKVNVHNVYNKKPYYQGQVSYYGNSDAIDSTYDLPSKIRSHRYHQQHKHYHQHQLHNRDRDNHHISRMNEYNRNSKWPHLSRVQYQLYEDERDDDLPPYIKKYNRRNKQLLDLLEGTMPPPTPPEFPEIVLNKKRERNSRRYHNHKNSKWIMQEVFEEQKANPNNPNKEDDQYVNDSASVVSTNPFNDDMVVGEDDELKLIHKNELPGDNMNVSQEKDNSDNNKDSEQGSQGKKPRNPINSLGSSTGITRKTGIIAGGGTVGASVISTPHDELRVSPKANNFIYHRVASPRVAGVVGTGGVGGSKKQRLPFVAITDRRLETSKTRQKDFEQNHLPLP